jgi:hypothetical protein
VVVKPWLKPISIKQILEERPFKIASDIKKRLSVTALLAWQPVKGKIGIKELV